MNDISSLVRPYFLYNCKSISFIGLDQSISESKPKFCKGILLHTLGFLFPWVTFFVPNNNRANFVFKKLNKFEASLINENFPKDTNVSVAPCFGVPTKGEDNFSPKAPVPLELAKKTL